MKINALLERKKQLRGEPFDDAGISEVRAMCRKEIDLELRDDSDRTKEAMVNRFLFGALLDTPENDFFYFIEPMFEFIEKMDVSPSQVKEILESEFEGFGF